MEGILKYLEKEPFSEDEILRLVDGHTNLVVYPQIPAYRSIDELLGKHGACIILYVTREDREGVFGHWTCLFRVGPKLLEFFDPYAYPPDGELVFTRPSSPPVLTDLILRSPYNVVYSQYELQRRNNRNINTCGRHVGMRLKFRDLPNRAYVAMMRSLPPLNPDAIVTMLTAFIK